MKKFSCVLVYVLVYLAAVFIGATGLSTVAGAQIMSDDLPDREGLEIDDSFILHTSLATDLVWDSNIFLSDQNEQGDLITILNPLVGIEFPRGDTNLSFEYTPTIAFFGKSKNHEQNYINHRARGLLEMMFTDFRLTIDDVYRRFTNRAGQDELGSAGRRTREQRNVFDVSVDAEYDQLEYEFGYQNRVRGFLEKDEALSGPMDYSDRNYMYNEGRAIIGYRAWPKTVILLESVGGYGYYHSDHVPSSWYTENLIGFKGEWLNNFIFDVRGGVKYQNFLKSDYVRNKDYVDFVARANVEYNFTDDDKMRVSYIRTNYDSIYQDMAYFRSDFVSLDYTHIFTDKLTGNLFGTYQLVRYPHDSIEDGVIKKRQDSIWSIGPLVTYHVNKWVSLRASYAYKNRSSNFGTFDYQDHVTSFRVTAGF